MKENNIKDKSFLFAVRMVNLCKYLVTEKKEYILSKQVVRSGTSLGAMVREVEHSESKHDFIHKLVVAQKEINETRYWLELLESTEYLIKEEFESINYAAKELIKMITPIIKNTKTKLTTNH